jgi:hypothetical protein
MELCKGDETRFLILVCDSLIVHFIIWTMGNLAEINTLWNTIGVTDLLNLLRCINTVLLSQHGGI